MIPKAALKMAFAEFVAELKACHAKLYVVLEGQGMVVSRRQRILRAKLRTCANEINHPKFQEV